MARSISLILLLCLTTPSLVVDCVLFGFCVYLRIFCIFLFKLPVVCMLNVVGNNETALRPARKYYSINCVLYDTCVVWSQSETKKKCKAFVCASWTAWKHFDASNRCLIPKYKTSVRLNVVQWAKSFDQEPLWRVSHRWSIYHEDTNHQMVDCIAVCICES